MSLSGIKNFFSLAKDINKAKSGNTEMVEGVVSDLAPELKVDIEDNELIVLKKKWEADWTAHYNSKLKAKQDEAERYWLGQSGNLVANNPIVDVSNLSQLGQQRPLADNLIFEALETFLPQATKQNPEPMVSADNTEEGRKISGTVQKMLVYLADYQRLKLKLKRVARNWALYYVGVIKVGWSELENDIILRVIRPQKLILDPSGTIEDGKYTGKYVGEVKKETADIMLKRFPSKEKYVREICQNKLGTEIQYIEWWTNEMLFWTLNDEVLDKVKNPNWNYDGVRTETEVNEYGEETSKEIEVRGSNHLLYPMMPYVFLSIFNIGKHPHDDTSLIEQNLSNQDIINKRVKQIDKSVDEANGGWIVSLPRAGLNKEQAGQLVQALMKGGVGTTPSDVDPNAVAAKIIGKGLPADVYNQLADMRNELRGVFGTTGLSPQGTKSEDTVRGKIIIRGQDTDRIGGLIAEYLEQFVDQIYNLMVQMMYVFYDQEHSAAILGNEGAQEWITLRNTDFNRKLSVSVKEGSLIPKDNLTQANQAVDLFLGGGLDPVTLFERLDFPNPRETAEKLMAYKGGQLLTNQGGLAPEQMGKEQPLNNQLNLLAQTPIT